MLSEQEYVAQSLELHLFFARIMKEHSIFLEAGFTPKDADFAQYADELKTSFEDILLRSAGLANGIIIGNVLSSGEIVTNYTLGAVTKTMSYTELTQNIESNNVSAIKMQNDKQHQLLILISCNPLRNNDKL